VRLLYVTDRGAIGDERFRRLLYELADAPGLSVSLRERDATDRSVLELASAARETLGPRVPLFLHRRLDIAFAARADGVQLPENGLPLARVRAAAPRPLRVGISTHSAAAAAAAIDAGADRVLLGPIFQTPGKAAFGPPLGPSALEALPPAADHRSEVYAIGGIDESRIRELDRWRDRISGVAAIRWIQEAPDPRAVAARIAAR
jgi:thiamine-phosphate pyrophosphorylase